MSRDRVKNVRLTILLRYLFATIPQVCILHFTINYGVKQVLALISMAFFVVVEKINTIFSTTIKIGIQFLVATLPYVCLIRSASNVLNVTCF